MPWQNVFILLVDFSITTTIVVVATATIYNYCGAWQPEWLVAVKIDLRVHLAQISVLNSTVWR